MWNEDKCHNPYFPLVFTFTNDNDCDDGILHAHTCSSGSIRVQMYLPDDDYKLQHLTYINELNDIHHSIHLYMHSRDTSKKTYNDRDEMIRRADR